MFRTLLLTISCFGLMTSSALASDRAYYNDSPGAIVNVPNTQIQADSRIVADLTKLKKKYKVKFTSGYSTSGHVDESAHYIGLAVDLIPDTKRGGTWKDVRRLADLARPSKNGPDMPWSQARYSGNGSAKHLHLQWSYIAVNEGELASGVYVWVKP